MFINFLVSFLHLEDDELAVNYYDWYEGAGQVIGAAIPIVASLIFVLLFYYVYAKAKAVNTGHWCLTGFVNMLVVFVLDLFIGRASLLNYILDHVGEGDVWDSVAYFPYSTDLWVFAINGIFWAAVFYFLLSVVLKKWSPVFNVPFGKSYKRSNY